MWFSPRSAHPPAASQSGRSGARATSLPRMWDRRPRLSIPDPAVAAPRTAEAAVRYSTHTDEPRGSAQRKSEDNRISLSLAQLPRIREHSTRRGIMKRLLVRLHKSPALTVRRTDVKSDRLVYVIVACKPQRYRWGRSCVVYVGTTKSGLGRIAASAAYRAKKVLRLLGVRQFEVRVVTCQKKPSVRTWRLLERALLLRFREKYGDVPACNQHGKRIQERDAFRYFRRERLDDILRALEEPLAGAGPP